MDLADSTAQYAAGGTLLALLAAFLLYQPPTNLVKWLQKKNYQYEVTFALYMLTPTEKFIFNSVLFLTVAMFLIATFLYLPDHIMTISRRSYYYFAGEAAIADLSRQASEALQDNVTKATDVMKSAATGIVESAYQVALDTAATAQEAVNHAVESFGQG